MVSINDITVGEHTYSADLLSARHAILDISIRARQAIAQGRDPGLSQIALMDLGGVIEDQSNDLHRVTMLGCSCGLLVNSSLVTSGHLDLRTMQVATTFVAADHEGTWAWVCQQCQQLVRVPDEPSARLAAREHHCAGLWA